MMKRILPVGILLSLILLGCSVVQVGGNENTYFPRAEGNKWVYEVESGGSIKYITAQMVEIKEGTFVWFVDGDQGENSGICNESDDNTDPLNDSTEFVVDSALGINFMMSGKKYQEITLDEAARRSILFSDDNTDPLNDSTEAVVDSALGINGIPHLFILQENSRGAVVLDPITTLIGSFSEYLRLEGEPFYDNTRYDAWLVSNIGPVEVLQWDGNEIVKRFRLVEFIPAGS